MPLTLNEAFWAVVRPGRIRRAVVVTTLAAAAALILAWQPPAGLSWAGQRTLAIFVIAIGLWVSKALPLMVTSMLAIILFPIFAVCPAKEAFAHFGHPAVFFILGTLILSAGMTENGVARRLALVLLRSSGRSPRSLVTGIFCFGVVASCFISEHAVAALELPIVLELAIAVRRQGAPRRLERALFFAMGWGCIIGGITTFLGGARAPLALGILEEGWKETFSFAGFALYALPVMLPVAAVGLALLQWQAGRTRVDLSAVRRLLGEEIGAMGPVSRSELGMGLLLAATIVLWVLSGPQWLAVIALGAAAIGFLCELISWPRVHEHVDWGLILMYGGAIVLGAMVVETGLAQWTGQQLLHVLSAHRVTWMFGGLLSLITLLLTEAMSNTAVVAATLPVAIPLGISMGLSGGFATLVVTLASGLAFCLPMSTPACAMMLSGGRVRPLEMLLWGLVLKVTAWAVLLTVQIAVWPWLGLH